jgi:hypothetical protein
VLALLLPLTACSAPDVQSNPATLSTREAVTPADRVCVRCHAQIAEEWSRSEHHASDDSTFRTALARERAPEFCVGCHAPFASAERTGERDAGAGVSCSSCHVGLQLGPFGHAHAPEVSAESASRVCTKCHEFDFPGVRQQREKLQLTVTEHAASSYANTPCVSCHMRRSENDDEAHASHAFAEARSAAALRAALGVESERISPTRVRLTLRSRGVGHAFPTGDLFRRLVLEADALGPDYAVLAHAERYLARHFGQTSVARDRTERTAVSDDRVQADAASVVELELGEGARGRAIAWRVRYERVLHLNPAHEDQAIVESSLLLADGKLLDKP